MAMGLAKASVTTKIFMGRIILQVRNAPVARMIIDQKIFFRDTRAVCPGRYFLLKTDHLVTVYYQVIKINLFCPIMISFLHNVEIKKFASGLQHPFGEGEEFCLIIDGIVFGIQGGVVY